MPDPIATIETATATAGLLDLPRWIYGAGYQVGAAVYGCVGFLLGLVIGYMLGVAAGDKGKGGR